MNNQGYTSPHHARVNRAAVLHELRRANGSIRLAAERLGIASTTLRNWLKRWGLAGAGR